MSSSSSTPGGMPLSSSMARASMSSMASTEESISSANEAFYANWEQSQSSDIRADVASGWGGDIGFDGRNNRPYGATSNSDNMDVGNDNDDDQQQQWGWMLQESAVRPVPTFYPLDSRATRQVNRDRGGGVTLTTEDVSSRISAACQSLSIHGVWDNLSPTAMLCSMELVEMEVNIYLGGADAAGE